MQISESEWLEYYERYKKLIYTISKMISGDYAIADKQDNQADLVVAALESINGYNQLTGKSFRDMMEDESFDKYTKTCLWNSKNKKGALITKKMHLTSKAYSLSCPLENDEKPLDIPDSRSRVNIAQVDISDLIDSNPKLQAIIEAVTKDPGLITKEGNPMLFSLAKKTRIPKKDLLRVIDSLKKEI